MEIKVIHLDAGEEIEIVTDSDNFLDVEQFDDFSVRVFAEDFPDPEPEPQPGVNLILDWEFEEGDDGRRGGEPYLLYWPETFVNVGQTKNVVQRGNGKSRPVQEDNPPHTARWKADDGQLDGGFVPYGGAGQIHQVVEVPQGLTKVDLGLEYVAHFQKWDEWQFVYSLWGLGAEGWELQFEQKEIEYVRDPDPNVQQFQRFEHKGIELVGEYDLLKLILYVKIPDAGITGIKVSRVFLGASEG